MPEEPSLEVALHHRLNSLTLDVQFRLTSAWTVLFAPSGAGKTTLLRVIAGLTQAHQATITWNQTPRSCVLVDTAKRISTPAHTRRLPMVTQNPALFPHLSVARNVSYGFPPHAEDHATRLLLQTLLHLCRIEHLGDMLPARISGGERQRVALARALGANARAILLDEPFAGLDAALKDDLMRDVKAWLGARSIPVLHVTHDVGEVFTTADHVIVLDEGRVIAQGTPELALAAQREHLLRQLGQGSTGSCSSST